MKRSNITRSTKPMKRSAIKPKRRRNGDTDESLAVRAAYREANPACELSPLLKRLGQVRQTDESGLECHHIVGSSGRIDLVSNLIMLSPTLHRWVESEPVVGRLYCVVAKSLKKPSEINADEFRRCSGMLLAGWIENHRAEWPICLRPHLEHLLASL